MTGAAAATGTETKIAEGTAAGSVVAAAAPSDENAGVTAMREIVIATRARETATAVGTVQGRGRALVIETAEIATEVVTATGETATATGTATAKAAGTAGIDHGVVPGPEKGATACRNPSSPSCRGSST